MGLVLLIIGVTGVVSDLMIAGDNDSPTITNISQNNTTHIDNDTVKTHSSSHVDESAESSDKTEGYDEIYNRPDGGGNVIIHHSSSNQQKTWYDESGYHKVSGDFDPAIVYTSPNE